MKDNLELIKNIPIILEVKRVHLTRALREVLGETWGKNARANSRKIFVYKISYRSKGKKLTGYIVEPREGKNLPCIVWNRGGSKDFGMIMRGELFCDFSSIVPLVKKGYIVIATQYPGVDGGEGEDEMGSEEDVASVLDLYKILKAYRRADVSRIGMYGHSRGGLMTYLCLAKVRWIKAAVIGAGSANEMAAASFRKDWKEHQVEMFGGSLNEKKKRSAVLWVDKFSKKTPLLLVHGTADWRVNPVDSIEMAKKLQQHKVPFRLLMLEGADHGFTEFSEEYTRQIHEWFERFVKNREALPNVKPHGK